MIKTLYSFPRRAGRHCRSPDYYEHIKRGEKHFYLYSVQPLTQSHIEVTRISILTRMEVKILLITEFFFECNYALAVASTWWWRTSAKRIFNILQESFPEEDFSGLDEECVKKIENRVQILEEEKMARMAAKK